MKSYFILILFTLSFLTVQSKDKKFYFSWGFNREWYSKSSIHFKGTFNNDAYDFTLVNAKAHDKPDYWAIILHPVQVTIPQYNYRIGYFINPKKLLAVEINFDHTKYVVTEYQALQVNGNFGSEVFNKEIILDGQKLVHFEHTDGANFLMLNLCKGFRLYDVNENNRFTIFTKLGAGTVIPRTDVTMKGERLNNKFHVAGYIAGFETSGRLNLSKRFYIESAVKTGFANYLNALTIQSGYARHHFTFFEFITSVGYCF